MESTHAVVGNAIYIADDLYRRANTTTTDSSDDKKNSTSYKIIGLSLAVASGIFIGISFVLKKHGLLKANIKYNEEAGEGYGYLKNAWWWTGMTLMILGEICNFAAYLFADAILVTPLGALSVVITAVLSGIFLKERLSFVGKIGCFLCVIGAVVIAANAPEQQSVTDIQDMQRLVISPGFLSFLGVILIICAFVAFWVGPRYGKKSMLVYLSVCSLIGGLSVSTIQGLGAAITAQARGEAQFNKWFTYVLLIFIIGTLVTEVIYLNKALNLFNAALVTPTYYVFFTSATIVTSAVLYQGFKGTAIQILTVVLGFFEICAGVVLLQLSKSAKDVPDTQVFKGDLDQVRQVAEQEEPEYEPRADTIRGGGAILRSFSKARQSRQMEEVKRIKEEHDNMQPIGENEQIEFDGIRRRRTIVGRTPSIPGSPMIRRKTLHPPLGMSKFPEPGDEHDQDDSSMHPGFFSHFVRRNRSSKTLPPTPQSESVPLSPVKASDGTYDGGLEHPTPKSVGHQYAPRFVNDSEVDTSYRGSGNPGHVQFASDPAIERPDSRDRLTPGRPQGPPHRLGTPGSAKRQFSFQNVFGRRNTDASQDGDLRPTSRGGMSFMSRGGSHTSTSKATEEERLGLVKGDSTDQLRGPYSGLQTESPPESEADWTMTGGSSPAAIMDDRHRATEASMMDRPPPVPRYTASPAPTESFRPGNQRTDTEPRGGGERQSNPSTGWRRRERDSSRDEKGPGGAAFI